MKIGQTLNVIASGKGKSIFWSERMNERIKELCIQSGAWEHYEINEGVDGDELPMQRFAELIVNECAQACETAIFEGQSNHVVSLNYAWRVRQHFGVKE